MIPKGSGYSKEGEKILAAAGDPFARDAALIAAAQRVERYEIDGYDTGGEPGLDDAKDVLEQHSTKRPTRPSC